MQNQSQSMRFIRRRKFLPACKVWLFVFAAFLFNSFSTALFAQTINKTRVTGAVNWNTASNWIQMRTGTITLTNGSTTVIGVGTSFTTELQVGDALMLDATYSSNYAEVKGVVSSIQSNTSLTLVSNVSGNPTTPGAYGRQRVPGSGDDVQIGNTSLTTPAVTVTLDSTATINSLTFLSQAVANSLTHSGTNALTISNNATINQATATVIVAWNINAGTATVNGALNINVTNSTAGRIARIVLTTGTLSVAGDINYTNSLAVANSVIDLSGGAATLNVGGTINVPNLGTLTPGTTSTVVYNGTGAQTVTLKSGITYNNITINKSAGTASLMAATTIPGNLTIQQGTLSASASNFNLTVNGNWANTSGTYSGGTSNVTLAGTSGTITGTTTFPNLIIDGASSTAYTMSSNNSCASLTFSTGNSSSTLTHSGTVALTVNGAVSLNQPGATATNAWNINAGSATVSGLISFLGNNTGVTRIARLVITTGTLNANGGMTFIGSANATKEIDMTGGAGIINLKGALTVPANSGTLSAGTAGSMFNFADDANAQTVNFFPAGAYHNLRTNNTHASGATLSAAITTANVTNNFRVLSGTFSNGGFAIALNTSKTFEVANGAIFRMTGTSGIVTGTSLTKIIGATSTMDYAGTTQTVSDEAYGHLTISGSGTKTVAAALSVSGTLTVSASCNLNLVTFALSGSITSIVGTGTIQTQNTSATPITAGRTWTCGIEYNAATGGQSIVAGTYGSLVNSNTSNSNTATGNLVVSGALTLNTNSVLEMASFAMSGSLTSVTGTGTLRTQSTTNPAIPAGKTWTGTIIYNNATGGQTIPAGTYTNLTNSNTSNVNSAAGAFSVSGTLTLTAGSTIDMGTNALSTAATLAGTGNIRTQNTSALPVPTAKTWIGSVEYNNPTGGQTVVVGTYATLIISNTSGSQTAAGALTISAAGSLTISAGATLDMSTFALLGATLVPSGTGTLRTANIATAAPFAIPININWTFNVAYTSAASQWVVEGTYVNLDISGGNRTINDNGTTTISNLFTPGAGVITVNNSIINYSGNNQTVIPMVYDQVIMSGGIKLFASGSATIKGLTIQASSTLQFSGGTILFTANSVIYGVLNQTGGTLLSSNDLRIYPGGVLNQSAGVIHMAATIGANPSDNLKIDAGGTVNQTGGTMHVKDYTSAPGTFNQNGVSALFMVFHDFKPGANSVFYSTAGTVQFTGNGSARFDLGSRQFNHVIINAGVEPKFSDRINYVIPISGNFTNNNTALVNTSNSTFIFNGTTDQTIYSASTVSSFGNMVFDNPDFSVTITSDIGVAGNWTITRFTPVELGSNTVRFSGVSKSINGSTAFAGIQFTATSGIYTMNADNTCSSLTIDASNVLGGLTHVGAASLTVAGDVVINQPTSSIIKTWSINAGTAIVGGNVQIGNINTSTGRVSKISLTTGSLSIGGNLVYNSPSATSLNAIVDLSLGASVLNIKGSLILTNGTGTLSSNATSNIYFNGTGAQTLNWGAAINYLNLNVVKPSGTITLGTNVTATNFYLTQGQLSGAGAFIMSIAGDWVNNGGTAINAPIVTFTGIAKTISGTGTTNFGPVTFNNGTSYTISNTNTCTGLSMPATSLNTTLTQTSTSNFTVNGNVTLNQPTTSSIANNWNIATGTSLVTGNITIGGTNNTLTRIAKVVVSTGALTVNGNIVYNSSSSTNSAATAVVDLSGGAGMLNLKGNLTLTNGTGTLSPGLSSTVNFNGTAAQSVSFASQIRYNHIFVNNPAVVTISGVVSSSLVTGDIRVQTGILSNGGFAIVGATGKTFEVVNGATYRLTGTSAMVTNFTKSFGASSTVEYAGAAQIVSAETYGNLTLTGSTGAVVKTMPVTTFTIVGNLTSSVGTASSVSYTAGAAIAVNGNVTIGASTTFTGSTFIHNIGGNWVNNGSYVAGTGTILMSGNSKTLGGSSTNTFFDLNVSGTNVSTASNYTVTGNLLTSGNGSYVHTGGTLTMSGTSKTISGDDIILNDVVFTGTISTIAEIQVAGNLTVNGGGTLTSTDGVITMTGASKSITNNGTLNIWNLSATGSITTASSFTIASYLDVTSGTLTATAGTITFTGTSTLDGTANLFNVTINGTSLQLESDAILGIANLLTKTAGDLDVITTTPNTVVFNGSSNKTIATGTFHNLVFAGNTNTAGGAITINGDITINAATTFAASTFTHTLQGDWTNNGTFTAGTSTILFAGDDDANVYGPTTFNVVTINNTSAENIVYLWSNISVATINMTLGGIRTGNSVLTITNTRNGNGIIMGSIQRTHAFSTGIDYAFEGTNNHIRFLSVTGVTTVTVKVTDGAIADFPFGGSVNREYVVTVPAGTYNANIRFHYENSELNGNSETAMVLWRHNGASWATYGKKGNDTAQNYIYSDSLTSMTGRWTFSDDNHVIRWNGSVSSDWSTAANWTAVQGVPTSPPSANDIVQIGFINYTYAPVITTAATAKSISFGSVKASTLSLSTGGSLTTQGNIGGSWSANATHTINVNGQNMAVNGDLILSDGTSGHAINVNIATGTLGVSGTLTQSGGANMVFTDAGNLNIGLNYTYLSGTFTRSTGTVNYIGTAAQVIAPVNYQNLVVNKNSGIATLGSAATISGNLTITKGEININATTTVAGNVSIASGAIMKSAIITLSVGGNWSNAGTFTPSSGTVNFNGSGAQSISASPFNNLTINKSAGTSTLTGNLAIANNLTITAGTLDVMTFTANRNTLGGIFTLTSGAGLLVGGASNFPSNYTTNTIGSASTVTFNGTIAQTVPVKTYGNLVFSNGGSNVKTMAGSFTSNGNLTINSGATFHSSSYTLTLAGNWTNNGTFTAATGTVRFSGASKTITGFTAFNILNVTGSCAVAGSNISTSGLFTISNGGSFATGTGTITINGDFTNSGSLSSTGTVTFAGTALQNIQFLNALSTAFNIANFNGTVSPVFSSTTSPTFNTLNINNTAPIAASISWTVNNAFTVSSGATFTGGAPTHNFYGSFTNNGTITSTGTLNIAPTTAQTIQLRGTAFTSTGTVIFGGSAAATISGTPNTLTHVTIANTVGVTPALGWTIAGNFSISSVGIFNAGSFSYTVAGDIQSSGTLNGGTSLFTMTSGAGTLSGSAGTIFYDFTNAGTIAVAADYKVARNFVNNATYDGSGGVLIMTGATAATLSGSASPYNIAQLTIQKSAGVSITLTKNVTGVSSLTVTSGILDAVTFTITQDVTNGGTMDIQNGGTLKIGGTNALPTFNSTTLGNTSTVEYYGSTQTITSVGPLGKTYGHLVISSAGTKTANGSLNILGNLTVTNATFVPGSFIDTLGGNFSMTSGSFTNTGNTFYVNGTSNQSVNANGTFNHFRVEKASGETNLASNITIAGTLTFTSGKITTTSSFNVITTSGTVSGASQETGWVNGNFRRSFASGVLTGSFPVGGVNNYTPFSLTFGAITVGGAITGSNGGVHAQLGTSGITLDKNIARTWTVANTGGVTFTNYAISLNWNDAQNYQDFDSTLLKVSLYNGSTWSVPTISGTPTSINVVASANTIFGDFIVGERCDVTGNFSYSANAFCTNGSNQSITLAAGSSAGSFSGNPAGMAINATTGLINVGTSVAKTYTVSNTVIGTGGCSTTSSFLVTLTAPPTAIISYPASPLCTTTGTGAVSRTGNAGGAYTSTAGLIINSTTGAVTPTTSTPGNYVVTYTIPALNGCSQFVTTTSVTINGDGYWKGTTSTNWNTGSNWQCGTAPSAGISIVIPGGLAFYPAIITDTFSVNNLTIQSGATLTVASGKIKIAGTITNSGTFTARTGNVEMNGTSAQTIPSGAFVSNLVKGLTVNNAAGVTLAGPVDILGILKIDNGSLQTNSNLTLKSNDSTTAQVDRIYSASPTPIVGTATVERYIPGRRKYRLIGSSVTTSASSTLSVGQEALSIWGNWQMSGSTAMQNQGTSITGGTIANGFDQLTTTASMYTYNDVSRSYTGYTTANGKNTKYTPLTAGRAYYMFIYGDRQNSASATSPRPTVLKATGTLLTGTQTFSTSSAIPLSSVTGRFTLIGNPFASIVDWKLVQKSNVSQTIWGWDANLNATGGYVTVTATGGGALVAPVSAQVKISRYIQPGQGFFVQTIGASPQISIREADKATDYANVSSLMFRENIQPMLAINLYYPSGTSSVLSDGSLVAYDLAFNNALDDEDGSKLMGTTEVLAMERENTILGIETRQFPVNNDTIHLSMSKITRPQYTLEIFADKMEALGLSARLYDDYLKTSQTLSLTDTNRIVFNVVTTIAESFKADRFKIIYSKLTTLPTASIEI